MSSRTTSHVRPMVINQPRANDEVPQVEGIRESLGLREFGWFLMLLIVISDIISYTKGVPTFAPLFLCDEWPCVETWFWNGGKQSVAFWFFIMLWIVFVSDVLFQQGIVTANERRETQPASGDDDPGKSKWAGDPRSNRTGGYDRASAMGRADPGPVHWDNTKDTVVIELVDRRGEWPILSVFPISVDQLNGYKISEDVVKGCQVLGFIKHFYPNFKMSGNEHQLKRRTGSYLGLIARRLEGFRSSYGRSWDKVQERSFFNTDFDDCLPVNVDVKIKLNHSTLYTSDSWTSAMTSSVSILEIQEKTAYALGKAASLMPAWMPGSNPEFVNSSLCVAVEKYQEFRKFHFQYSMFVPPNTFDWNDLVVPASAVLPASMISGMIFVGGMVFPGILSAVLNGGVTAEGTIMLAAGASLGNALVLSAIVGAATPTLCVAVPLTMILGSLHAKAMDRIFVNRKD